MQAVETIEAIRLRDGSTRALCLDDYVWTLRSASSSSPIASIAFITLSFKRSIASRTKNQFQIRNGH